MSRYRGDREPMEGLTWGLGLIALGVMFLAVRQGLLPWNSINEWWPAFPMVLGIAGIIAARTAKKLGSAVTLTLMSGYFFASVYHWNGMSWATSWPLALVAVGMGAVVEAIATRFMPYGKDDERIHLERERDHE
ncbi:MAG: hypothetical protein IPJ04_08740 [Candidatus Eisenbacteria bacterium]|nr:hypothetical protein [Candidatus Eisenbacteria bacterium]